MSEENTSAERRGFLTVIAGGALALLGAAASAVGAGFLYPVGKVKPPPLFICLESEVPAARPKEIHDLLGRKVLLMRAREGLIAVSTICSHLGCSVFYRAEKKIFECPCHQGVFDGEGNPVSGPPQTPLARYPVTVRDGKVFVDFA